MKTPARLSPVRLSHGTCCAVAWAAVIWGAGCTAQVQGGDNPSVSGTGSQNGGGSGGGNGTGSGSGAGTGSESGSTGGGSPSGGGGSGGTTTTAGDPNAAGVRPLRLLTSREYVNTVRDLLGDTSILTSGLPSENEDPASSFAFHSTGTVATLDATLYRDAAEALAKNALGRMNTLLPCAASTTSSTESTCLNTFMTTLAVKLYRRPLLADDVTRLTDIFNTGKTTLALNFSNAIGFVIETVLQSPEFLYHWEVDGLKTMMAGGVLQLGNYELANRLSYFLWGTMPDDTLFAAAKAGQLSDVASVDAQVRRMLKDSKASSTMADFFTDWLDIDVLPDKPKDATIYPMYNDALTTAMAGEIQSFVTAIMVNGSGHFDELMTGTSSFANQPLAALYGITGVTGTALKAVSLNPMQRSGLLTSAAFMSLTGGASGSNPPRRGKAILYKLLCRELPPVPAQVPDPKPVSPGVTTRQRFEEHSSNPCATACHTLLDPLGFAFENYDGIGQYRTMDNNLPVNASVTLTLDGKSMTLADARGLAGALAGSDEAQTCFTKQWFRFALGRLESSQDMASVNSAATAFKGATRDVRELIVGLATSRTFRFRTPAAGEVLQ